MRLTWLEISALIDSVRASLGAIPNSGDRLKTWCERAGVETAGKSTNILIAHLTDKQLISLERSLRAIAQTQSTTPTGERQSDIQSIAAPDQTPESTAPEIEVISLRGKGGKAIAQILEDPLEVAREGAIAQAPKRQPEALQGEERGAIAKPLTQGGREYLEGQAANYLRLMGRISGSKELPVEVKRTEISRLQKLRNKVLQELAAS